ncbi:hypothetical protein [uncultured Serinicoccus sp.]|uniref:hypothetical protein n=1 Tax=uncultured Serinicoccus sp. TaxID=735514 RepID=UPI00260811FB|nr:hypothetical protein [uncultured Serinicoccus sp.]
MSSSMTTRSPYLRRAAAPVLLLALLTGCTGGGSSPASAPDSATSTLDASAGGDSGDASASPTTGDVNAGVTAAPSADAQEPMKTDDPDPEMASGAPAVSQDFSDDAGADLEEYDYPDDPEPAESVVATLCNLNRGYFSSLAESADADLRMAVVGVTELLGYWESLVPHYPAVEEDVATAGQIVAKWDEAVLARDNGEDAAAETALGEAEELITSLPDTAEVDCVP